MTIPQIVKPRCELPDRSALAAYLGISRPTLYAALATDRITYTASEIIYQPAKRGRRRKHWHCIRCQRNNRHTSNSKICLSCLAKLHADGLCWCGACQSVTQRLTALSVCRECAKVYWQRANAKRRPRPPTGYVRASQVAKRLHYSRTALKHWFAAGWMADQRWKAPGATGAWYAPDLPVYPDPPSKRQERA